MLLELLESQFPKVVLLEHRNLNEHSEVHQKQKIYKQISALPQMSLLGRPLPSVTASILQIRDLLDHKKSSQNATISPCSFPSRLRPRELSILLGYPLILTLYC